MDPFAQLLTQSSGHQVAPETLEMLGRQASQMFQSQGVPLNDAVSKILSSHPELGNEHVKRIVEFANTVTFQQMFQNSTDKNVHFDVADPGVILRDLKDGGSPGHEGKPLAPGSGDYKLAPGKQDTTDLERMLSEQFNPNIDPSADMGKTASLRTDHELHANPVEDVYDAHVQLRATREKLASSYETLTGMMVDSREALYHQVKQEVLDPDGAGLGGVISVMEKIADREIANTLMQDITERLIEEGVQTPVLEQSLRKLAGVVPNLEHPLFGVVNGLLKTAEELVNCGLAIDDVDASLVETSAFLKKAGSLTTGIKQTIAHKGHVPAGIRQRFPRE